MRGKLIRALSVAMLIPVLTFGGAFPASAGELTPGDAVIDVTEQEVMNESDAAGLNGDVIVIASELNVGENTINTLVNRNQTLIVGDTTGNIILFAEPETLKGVKSINIKNLAVNSSGAVEEVKKANEKFAKNSVVISADHGDIGCDMNLYINPDLLKASGVDTSKKMYIYHISNGVADEKIEYELEYGVIVSGFSQFVITNEDIEITPNNNNNNTTTSNNNGGGNSGGSSSSGDNSGGWTAPKTGVADMNALYVLMAVVAAGACFVVLRKRETV